MSAWEPPVAADPVRVPPGAHRAGALRPGALRPEALGPDPPRADAPSRTTPGRLVDRIVALVLRPAHEVHERAGRARPTAAPRGAPTASPSPSRGVSSDPPPVSSGPPPVSSGPPPASLDPPAQRSGRTVPRSAPRDLRPAHPTTRGPRVAILVPEGSGGQLVGRAVALALAGPPRRGHVAVLAHRGGTPEQGEGAPARIRVERLAARLRAASVDAHARGRLVEVDLPALGCTGLAAWERASTTAAGAALVAVLHGSRTEDDDELLARQDDVLAVVPRAVAPAVAALGDGPGRVPVRVIAADLPDAAVPKSIARRHPAVRAVVSTVLGGPGARGDGEAGQALLLVLGALLVTVILAAVAGALAAGLGAAADDQRAADLAALSAARSMASDYADVDVWQARDVGLGAGGAMARATYLGRAERAARATARRNGAPEIRVTFPGTAGGADGGRITAAAAGAHEVPTQVRVAVMTGADAGRARLRPAATADAELVPPASSPLMGAGVGEYSGPLAFRDGKPMRPDVALAYDRMRAAAQSDGVALVVVSGYRSDAEQAVLFARRPDPKWVAPPGQSLHRLGTELDLGPNSAWPWLARNARRFGFIQRYSWEPWHFGYVRNAGSASLGYGSTSRRGGSRASRGSGAAGDVAHDGPGGGDGGAGRGDGSPGGSRAGGDRGPTGATLPDWVPAAYRPMIARAAQRWNVGAVLLAAQLKAESNFVPTARSPAGALGIAQFMPATARQYGLRDPRDPAAAIDAQGHLMRDLLRDFGSVPLALAAYNAGPAPVRRCGCAGPYAETRTYVARILAIMLGAGDPLGAGADALTIRLVR